MAVYCEVAGTVFADKVIIFLSDGNPNQETNIFDTIREKNAELHNEVVIHTYGIGDGMLAICLLL